MEKGGQISGGGGAGGGWDSIFENDQSSKVLSIDTAKILFDTSTTITGAEWPTLKQITSPCPTLKVIGAVTRGMVKREELKRMREMGRPGMSDDELEVMDKVIELAEAEEQQATGTAGAAIEKSKIETTTHSVANSKRNERISKRQRVIMAADSVVSFALRNTIGRVARLVGGKLLGKIPETAKAGSYHEEIALETPSSKAEIETTTPISGVDSEGMDLLEEAISVQLKEDATTAASIDMDNNYSEDEALFSTLYEERS